MVKAGIPFELLTEDFLMAWQDPGNVTIEQNVMLDGADGPRQFDVVMRGAVGPVEVLVVFECRDWKKKLDVTALDGFESKMRDVGANKGVIVNRRGFSKKARTKATRLGIGLYTLNDGPERLAQAGIQLPVIVRELKVSELNPSWTLRTADIPDSIGAERSLPNPMRISGQDLMEFTRERIMFAPVDELIVGANTIVPLELQPWWYEGPLGVKIPVQDVTVGFEIEEVFWFGYLSDSESTVALVNELTQDQTVRFKAEDVFGHDTSLARIDGKDAVASLEPVEITVVSVPQAAAEVNLKVFGVRKPGSESSEG